MDVTDFDQIYFNELLNKISKEEKNIFFLGDFNINLLCYNENRHTNDFLDSLAFSSSLPNILQPTRLIGSSKTLISNIFRNVRSHELISGNITATTSYHLPQFLIDPNLFVNPLSNKSNIFESSWSNFNQGNSILDYFSIDWKSLLKIEQQNINFSLKTYRSKINSLVNTHAPLKKLANVNLNLKPNLGSIQVFKNQLQ